MNIALIIAILVALLIIAAGLIAASFIYKKSSDKSGQGSGSLAKDFHLILYSALFGSKDPDEVAEKLGIKPEDYYNNCKTCGVKPDIKKMIATTIYGLVIILAGIIIVLLVNPIFGILLMIIGLLVMLFEKQRLKTRAKDRRNAMSEQLPDFLDLLKTELVVGIPVENAIFNICERKDNLLSREFFRTMREMRLGASDWATALEEMADRYEINNLTDFVLEVTTAYRNGSSVAEAVVRKAGDIRNIHLLNVKERAGKTSNTVLLPLTIFQIIPMIVFLIIPILSSFSEGLSF